MHRQMLCPAAPAVNPRRAAAGAAAGGGLDAVNDSPIFISPLSPMKPSSRSLTLRRSTPASPSESESLSRAVISRFCPGPSSYRRCCRAVRGRLGPGRPLAPQQHPHPRGRHRFLGRLARRGRGVRERRQPAGRAAQAPQAPGTSSWIGAGVSTARAMTIDATAAARANGTAHSRQMNFSPSGIAEDAGRLPAPLPGQGRSADPQEFLRLETEQRRVRADQPPRVGLRRQIREATFLDGEDVARADPDRQPDLLGREPPALAALSQQPPDQHRALRIDAGCGRLASSPHHRSPRLRPAGDTSRAPCAAAPARDACKSGSSRCRRDRGAAAPRADRRRCRAGAWRRSAAGCAARPTARRRRRRRWVFTICQARWRVRWPPRAPGKRWRLPPARRRAAARSGEIREDRRASLLAEGDEPLLVALAPHADQPGLEIQLLEAQRGQLRDPQAAVVEQREQQGVAQPHPGAPVGMREQPLDLVAAQIAGQLLPAPRRLQIFRRVLADAALEQQEPVEGPHGGEAAGAGGRGQPALRPATRGTRAAG